ncbi:hypothetical protein DICVIV_09495 [Dictyocaulus viviparus]|uniref:Uncharacterized protein n=1 Tax=Dictyocaulus viviparus TaxID=29172 RepID=A0A0D8XL22_DICVI|nr:hypothetical protein DICVIV_09495 [Dictyocaulus viviparus]
MNSLQPIVIRKPLSHTSSEDASCEESTSVELVIADESPNQSNFALLVSGHPENDNGSDYSSGNLHRSASVTQNQRLHTIIDRLHLELVNLPNTSTDDGFRSVSYSEDMKKFSHGHHISSFMDPFEEEHRRSRTEIWVESTSPGHLSDNDDVDAIRVTTSDKCVENLEVKPFESPEKCTSSSPPCNTTTSTTTAIDEELAASGQAVHVNYEAGISDENTSEVENISEIELPHPLSSSKTTSSEKSEINSFVSSDLDKTSIVKLKFTSNLHRAREDAKKEEIKCYESNSKRHRRNRTPTIERVVMYYTTDRRRSSLSPSPASLTMLQHSLHLHPSTSPRCYNTYDDGHHLSVQSAAQNSSLLVKHESFTSEPETDENTLITSLGAVIFFVTYDDSENDLDDDKLDEDEPKNDFYTTDVDKPTSSTMNGISSKNKSTSTDDLTTFYMDFSKTEGRGLDNIHKRAVRDKSTITSPSLNDDLTTSSTKQIQEQAKLMLSSAVCSSPIPIVVLEDAPDKEVSLPDFKDQLSDLESSSTEDLLAIDTRPNSHNRKSVTFSDTVNVEVVATGSSRNTPSPDFRNSTVKPILKKEDKQRKRCFEFLSFLRQQRTLLYVLSVRIPKGNSFTITL